MGCSHSCCCHSNARQPLEPCTTTRNSRTDTSPPSPTPVLETTQATAGVTPPVAPFGATACAAPTLHTKAAAAPVPAADDDERDFYFLDAVKLTELDSLPTLQDGLRVEGLVRTERLSLKEIIRGTYTTTYLAVSHRWERKAAPDPNSQQMSMLINYLRKDPLVKSVWYDYSCMWQGERTDEQEAEFQQMLADVNFLYLGCRVLILAVTPA